MKQLLLICAVVALVGCGKKDDGQVRFYKDGYTDLRGRFDYVSLNTGELDNVQSFAILILNDDHGAIIREAKPPKQ